MFAPFSCSVGERNHGAIFKAQIMAENTENSEEFLNSQEDLQKLEVDSVPENTKKQTSWGLKKFSNQFSLRKNCFPTRLTKKVVNQYLSKSQGARSSLDTQRNSSGSRETAPHFFKLPYIGPISIVAQKRIRHLVNRYCSNLDIKLVFSSFNIRSMF